LVRPLSWLDPSERRLWQIDDAFLVGDALLVAPVVQEGATQRMVYLPAGTWYDFESERVYAGGQEVTLDAPLGSIPALARAGSILPLETASGLELHLYAPEAGKDGAGILYSDAGDGYGPYRVDNFHLRRAGDHYEFSGESNGDYPWTYGSVKLVLHGGGHLATSKYSPEAPGSPA